MRTSFGTGPGASFSSLPWGDGYTANILLTGGGQDNEHFAGLEHDAESDTEHAQFRNYASAQGRWLAPDSSLGSYDLINPQSMNRYAYVLNNPLSLIDPSGLEDEQACGDDEDCGGSGDDGGGDGGGGVFAGADDTPVNPGDPFVFQLNTFATSLSDYQPLADPLGYFTGFQNSTTSLLGALPGLGGVARTDTTLNKLLKCPSQASAASQAYTDSHPFDPLVASIKGSAVGLVRGAAFGAYAGAQTGAVATIPFGPGVAVGGALEGGAVGAIFGAIRGAVTGPLTNYIKTQAISAYIYGSGTIGCLLTPSAPSGGG